MEKNNKPTKCVEVIAGKALHVKRFTTELEQYCLLTEALSLWKEKVEVVTGDKKYTEGLFVDIERKANEIPSVKPLLTNLALIREQLPEFKTFQPRYLVGHRYSLDGSLKPHVGNVPGWAVIVNIGCSAVLEISQRKDEKKHDVRLKSGDAFVFACDQMSGVMHSIKKIIPGTCPKKLKDLAADRRYALILRDYLATEIASLLALTEKFEEVVFTEGGKVHKVWDTSDSFKNQVLHDTFPSLPLEMSKYLTEQLDARGLGKFAQLSTGTNNFVHLSDDLWRKVYCRMNQGSNDFKLRTTWEHLSRRSYFPEPDESAAVVIHFGSFNVQYGLAGTEIPYAMAPNIVKKFDGHCYAGEDTFHINGGELIRPIIAREVISTNAFEMMWEYSMTRTPHRWREDIGTLALLTDPKAAIREKATQIAFENWDTPIYYLANPQVTGVYAAGVTSALVVDVGHDIISVNIVYEGYLLPHIVKVVKVGGRAIEAVLRERLQKDCPELLEHVDLESFKRKYCYVKQNNDTTTEERHVVVDGKTYSLNSTVLTDPCEVLFNPEKFNKAGSGLMEQIESVRKALTAEDKELEKIANTVVVLGGPTLHEGFIARLEQELKEMFPNLEEFKIIANDTRHVASWIGGSILGSLSTFPSMWVTKREYDESGPSIVHRKCF